MIVLSKPLGGLFKVPDFGLSDDVLSKNRERRDSLMVSGRKLTQKTNCK